MTDTHKVILKLYYLEFIIEENSYQFTMEEILHRMKVSNRGEFQIGV